MIGLKTIRTGQRAAIWNRKGEVKFVDGPKVLFLLAETVDPLIRYSATPGEYLIVRFRDGRTEHLCGPVDIWLDPVLHQNITVKKCISVSANEAVVVYRREAQKVHRRVEHGPAIFMPTAEEWLHTFRWHGADPKKPERKIPGALNFTKLRVIPDQSYVNVDGVRTADDALLTIQLMIFFELKDITVMLDQTHDVVADFTNAVSADVIDFVAGLKFETFKEKTEALNNLNTYKALVERSKRIGYQINKIVYRGYRAGSQLQAMHDSAIETRTELRLEAETEQQSQELEDLKLQREVARAQKRREIEKADATHRLALKNEEHALTLHQKQADEAATLEAQRQRDALTLETERKKNEELAGYLNRMQTMNVDLTRYLVAQYQHPDRLIRIDGSNGNNGAQLHLHE